jgi:hypothetical protein
MYAIHETGMAAGVSLAPAFVNPTPGSVEPRAVESAQSGSLESEGRDETIQHTGSPVVRLIEDSAQRYAEMMALVDQGDASSVSTAGAYLGNGVGQSVDLYA